MKDLYHLFTVQTIDDNENCKELLCVTISLHARDAVVSTQSLARCLCAPLFAAVGLMHSAVEVRLSQKCLFIECDLQVKLIL